MYINIDMCIHMFICLYRYAAILLGENILMLLLLLDSLGKYLSVFLLIERAYINFVLLSDNSSYSHANDEWKNLYCVISAV